MSATRRGFTLIELLVVIAIIALLMGILLPAIGRARDSSLITISMDNLRNFGTAHAVYASEWSGRQWTTCPDDLTVLTGGTYTPDYESQRDFIPSVPLGFDRNGGYHETWVGWAIQPLWWAGSGGCPLGNFRAFQTKPFNQYINGKVYDPIFWAPKDYTINEDIHQWWDDPGEWPWNTNTFYFSTYCTSVAAQVSPEVYAARDGDRGTREQRARSLPGGHRTPNLSSARYPDLKTHMLEHYWLQNNPSESIPGARGVPWFFNMGADSTPATLFFDSSVRMMSVREAVQSDKRVQQQGEPSLVACDAGCFGCSGYFENHAYGGDQDAINSYHVFTRDGIMGRDTASGGG